MLRPVILIGCGGSGQKAVRYVRDAVSRRLAHAGWEGDVPSAWQFLAIDTLNIQESAEKIPVLPAKDYLSISLKFTEFNELNDALLTKFPKGSEGYREMMGWRPNPSINVPLKDGAAQMRAIGRCAGAFSLQEVISKRLLEAFGSTEGGGPELQRVSEKLTGIAVPPGTQTPQPLVMVLGSMAGGTGSGIMLDVLDLIRRSHTSGKFPVAVVFSADIFGDVANDSMAANGLAFMSELLSAYWDTENSDAALVPGIVRATTRGPHATFLIGRKNIDGLDLEDSNNVYRAVGETLAAVTTSGTVQDDFHNFVTVNWAAYSPANAGGYGFNAAAEQRLPGALSSFGSSTLSIGRDRFSNYAVKLLERSVLDFLANGFSNAAFQEFGDSVTTMPAVAQQERLVEKFLMPFMNECELLERGDDQNQLTDLVSAETRRDELIQRATQILKSGVPQSRQTASKWWTLLKAQENIAKKTLLQENEDWTTKTLNTWAPLAFERVLTTTTKYAGKLSLPVTLKILVKAQSELAEVAGEVHQNATKIRNGSVAKAQKAQEILAANQKGELAPNNSAVEDAFKAMAQSLAMDASATSLDRIAVAMESLASGILGNLAGHVEQTLGKVRSWVSPKDGQASLVAEWPKNDGTVPNSFAPSPVEFFLEDYTEWPKRLKGLIFASLTSDEKTSGDSVDIARSMIVNGKYGSKGIDEVLPLFWSGKNGGTTPRWTVNSPLPEIETDIDHLEERVTAWLKRSGTELEKFLQEGLQAYLQALDSNNQPVPNHIQRLQVYKQRLQEALQQSRPLFELDKAMYSTVHKQDWSNFTVNVQGFPFPEGHPAREITEQVLEGFGGSDLKSRSFNSTESESVLITSLLRHPINPSVVTSFTQPLTQAFMTIKSAPELQGDFWRYRRSRILENFIPLPDELRRAAIRGFIIGRLLGYVTADTSKTNRIAGIENECDFPKWMLTPVDVGNLLPALLEAFPLCFGETPTKGKEAFAPYRELIDLGMSSDLASENFVLFGDCLDFINTGNLNRKPVDELQADSMRADTASERQNNFTEYLKENIARYEELAKRPLDNKHWREKHGSVTPQDTVSLELMRDILDSYNVVLKSVETALGKKIRV